MTSSNEPGPDPPQHGAKCGANTRHGPCKNPAGFKTSHPGYGQCTFHGGHAPGNVIHANRVMAIEAARKFGLRVDISAEQALLDELALSRGIVEFCREQAMKLAPAEMVYGTERVTLTQRPASGGSGMAEELTTVSKSQPHMWIVLLRDAERHHFAVAAEIARLGIEARRVELEREQVTVMRQVILAALYRFAGITEDDPRVAEELPAIIRGKLG